MRKVLGLLALCLLFTSCSECLHDGATRQRLFEEEDCTCIEIAQPLPGATTYFFAGEKVPVKIEMIIDSNRKTVVPQVSRKYKIRYSYWRCTGCQKLGRYRIQDVMILEELNDKN